MRLLFFWILFFPFFAWGQKSSEKAALFVKLDTSYIINYEDLLSVNLFGILKSNQIGHYDNWTQRFVYYRPNENFNIGLGVSYKWLSMDLAFNFSFINNDNDIYGETKLFDIQTNVYLRTLTFDFNYQRYKGYYGSNAPSYIPGFNFQNPQYPIRPDIQSQNIAANAQYVFNSKKFSYRAAFVYNERQVKSAGSWLAGTYLGYFKMEADSTIIPKELADVFNPDADFRNTRYFNIGVSGGYGHTFVVTKKIFFSLSLSIGFGPAFKSVPSSVGQEGDAQVRFSASANFRSALGYNGDRFYAGISAVSTQTSEVDPLEARLERNVNQFKIFVGKRFGRPAFFEKIRLRK